MSISSKKKSKARKRKSAASRRPAAGAPTRIRPFRLARDVRPRSVDLSEMGDAVIAAMAARAG